MMQLRQNLAGLKFSKLTVISFHGWTGNRHSAWLCGCDCGNQKVIRGDAFKSGAVRSCGCGCAGLEKLPITKASKRRQYFDVWKSMIQRCINPKRKDYKYYGGRGIKVCQRWLISFAAFTSDMGARPDGMTIERIKNDGDYEPSNCKWATRKEQRHNQRMGKLAA